MKKANYEKRNCLEKLESIQALRGLAAFLVLIFHLNALIYDKAGRPERIGEFWSNGFAGVDMFFVISGFIIVYVTRETHHGYKSSFLFLYSRITRIYPLWWIFAGLMMGYFWFTYGQPAAPDKVMGAEIKSYITKSLMLLPQFHDPVLGVGWTLIHEMLFYCFFALSLIVSRKFLPIFLLGWAGLIIFVGLLGKDQPFHAQNFRQLILSPLNVEFLFGAFCALLFERFKTIPSKRFSPAIIFWSGTGLFMLALIIGTPGEKHLFNWMRVIIFGFPCALIVLGCASMELQGKIQIFKPFRLLGDWSYSLYLSHILVLLSLRRIWQIDGVQPFLPEFLKWGAAGFLDEILFICIGIVLSLVTACVSFVAIERTSIRFFRGLF